MTAWLDSLLAWLAGAPAWSVYVLLGAAAAVENLFPPIPADVVVVFGGLLAGRGVAEPWLVFLAVWACNVAGALLVYALGRRYGTRLFRGRWGEMLLRPHQLRQLERFYRRFGGAVVFLSRFLPMFRAVVPVFAGVSQLGVVRTALPIAAASAIWYGALVYLGAAAGRNWHQLMAMLETSGHWLWMVAAALLAALAAWWWRSRSDPRGE